MRQVVKLVRGEMKRPMLINQQRKRRQPGRHQLQRVCVTCVCVCGCITHTPQRPHSYPSTSPLIPLNVPPLIPLNVLTHTPQRPHSYPHSTPYSYPSTPSLIPPTHTPHSDLLDSELIPLNVPPLIPLNFPTMYMYLCIAQTWYGVVQPSVLTQV